jgi:hypothetical protein
MAELLTTLKKEAIPLLFSLLYLLTILAVLLFTGLTIRSIIKDRRYQRWLFYMVGSALVYFLLVAVSVWV